MAIKIPVNIPKLIPRAAKVGEDQYGSTKETRDYINNVLETHAVHKELQTQLAETAKRAALLGDTYDATGASLDAYSNAIIALQTDAIPDAIQGIDSLIDKHKELQEAQKTSLGVIADYAEAIGNQLSGVFSQYASYLIAQRDALLENTRMSAHEQERINKEFAEKLQKIATIEAIMNVAVGVTKALAQGGVLGLITGGLVAAKGALEIATIKAQKLAKGGVIPEGFPNDTYPAMLSSKETVLPAPKPIGLDKIESRQDIYLQGELEMPFDKIYLRLKRIEKKLGYRGVKV